MLHAVKVNVLVGGVSITRMFTIFKGWWTLLLAFHDEIREMFRGQDMTVTAMDISEDGQMVPVQDQFVDAWQIERWLA